MLEVQRLVPIRVLPLAASLILIVAACSADAEPGATSAVGDTPEPANSQVTDASPGNALAASEEPTPSDLPSPATEDSPKLFKVGEPIDVTGDFISSDVRVTVEKVKQAKKFGAYSKPAKGNVYLAVEYAYEALEDGATYNPLDWQVFVDDVAIDNFTFVMDGPSPELHSGSLPKGRKATGWVVYEVPAKGKVVLSYGANIFGGEAPTFEVIAREK